MSRKSDEDTQLDSLLNSHSISDIIQAWISLYPARTQIIFGLIWTILFNLVLNISITAIFSNPINLLAAIIAIALFYFAMQFNSLLRQKEEEVDILKDIHQEITKNNNDSSSAQESQQAQSTDEVWRRKEEDDSDQSSSKAGHWYSEIGEKDKEYEK